VVSSNSSCDFLSKVPYRDIYISGIRGATTVSWTNQVYIYFNSNFFLISWKILIPIIFEEIT